MSEFDRVLVGGCTATGTEDGFGLLYAGTGNEPSEEPFTVNWGFNPTTGWPPGAIGHPVPPFAETAEIGDWFIGNTDLDSGILVHGQMSDPQGWTVSLDSGTGTVADAVLGGQPPPIFTVCAPADFLDNPFNLGHGPAVVALYYITDKVDGDQTTDPAGDDWDYTLAFARWPMEVYAPGDPGAPPPDDVTLPTNPVLEEPIGECADATLGLTTILLTWSESVPDAGPVEYAVYRKLAGEPDFTLLVSGLTGLTYVDESVPSGIEACYRIAATDTGL